MMAPTTMPGTDDPHGGSFSMEQALEGLPDGPGPLRAVITTELGVVTCELRADKAPISVANFVGLARGRRAFRDESTKTWGTRRFYDGLTFHSIIKDFMAQGGDPRGTGTGGPGYTIADEVTDLVHTAGTLAYAKTSAPNSAGSQFYITQSPQPHLDGMYSVFGYCSPQETIDAIASVATKPPNHVPVEPIHTQTVVITRCAP
jgi:peptidyl-prolyl cis-trans isomerase A (cyclophilin A)